MEMTFIFRKAEISEVVEIFWLPQDSNCSNNTTAPILGSKDYVAFDLEWKDNNESSTSNNRIIYAAAFVHNHGNQKVLHISDFANLPIYYYCSHPNQMLTPKDHKWKYNELLRDTLT